MIDTAPIRKYVARRQSEGAKNATVNRELAALRRMYRLAVQAERIPRIPDVPMLQESNADSLKTKVAEVYGNRTHRAYLPVNPTGFEVQADHQAGFTSAVAPFYQKPSGGGNNSRASASQA